MSDIPMEKRFKMLVQICRACHFEMRQAALELCPEMDPMEFVKRYWTIVGHDTSPGYIKNIDPSKPLPKQLANNFAFSAQVMGETSYVVEGKDDSEAFVKTDACPYYDWHKRYNVLEEDQPGCDAWIDAFVDDINKALGTNLKWETLKSLPAGDGQCLRRFYVE
ncbi:MAG TPA: hypothetical protein DCQ14_01105 [Firmicutes bacterium]|nr:hypothetical protein [Bacillota bacterium]